MNALITEGYDGFIRSEDGEWYETNAFRSNQIKSATENNGEFSEEDNDIRFSRSLSVATADMWVTPRARELWRLRAMYCMS